MGKAMASAKATGRNLEPCLVVHTGGDRLGAQAAKRSTPNPAYRANGGRVHLCLRHAYAALAMSEMKRSMASRKIIRRPPTWKLATS
jgi:hypothetical protein